MKGARSTYIYNYAWGCALARCGANATIKNKSNQKEKRVLVWEVAVVILAPSAGDATSLRRCCWLCRLFFVSSSSSSSSLVTLRQSSSLSGSSDEYVAIASEASPAPLSPAPSDSRPTAATVSDIPDVVSPRGRVILGGSPLCKEINFSGGANKKKKKKKNLTHARSRAALEFLGERALPGVGLADGPHLGPKRRVDSAHLPGDRVGMRAVRRVPQQRLGLGGEGGREFF
jgi:hypothetical protein